MPGPMPRGPCRTGWDMEVHGQRFFRAARRSPIASRAGPAVNECLRDTGSPKSSEVAPVYHTCMWEQNAFGPSGQEVGLVFISGPKAVLTNEMRGNNASATPRRRNKDLGDLHLQRQIIHLRDR